MLKALLALPGIILAFAWSFLFPEHPCPAPSLPPPMPGPEFPSEESQRVGHEVTDANAKTMIVLGGGLFGAIFITMAALGWMYTHLYAPGNAMPVTPLQASFEHGPRARTSISKDWEEIDAQTRDHLTGYAWTERARGIVRIPITDAMRVVSKEGLPARAGVTPFFPSPDQEKLPLSELETNTNANSYDPGR